MAWTQAEQDRFSALEKKVDEMGNDLAELDRWADNLDTKTTAGTSTVDLEELATTVKRLCDSYYGPNVRPYDTTPQDGENVELGGRVAVTDSRLPDETDLNYTKPEPTKD